ncbi:aminotransferase class III-fold pyridoxal phosphate-dependent enzyme [Steroidobacter sp. S1-65]|uniref:Aminotransferase class III-fold pyridoxal phosphate-dependent enzyme n=1 Tax=Steroidobacter gossypii TaxID=2805490 RepID=A0ABS1X575_9GAMM|nr:transaminase [Steroidobacter gossypii]MBM0108384.1 aminotransferase class III-fold pyridoxal phosphate-dependent enzyme [Steroidobacter gossypii]
MQSASSSAAALLERERRRFIDEHPESLRRDKALREHWLNGVPMHWMTDWQLPAPLVLREAAGARLVDVDGHSYADFCLGDTGAMFGHSPPAVARALSTQAVRGLTCMLPTELTARAGELLTERFGLPFWQITQTATDANRAVLRWARALTGRKCILVFDGCYHGSLEDTLVRLEQGRVIARPGQVGQVADFASHARVVEFNDLPALEAALAGGEVACLLAEPVMTNAGMVLPQDGFWSEARKLCARHGTLLAIDETHTLSSGPRGHAHRLGLEPDFLVAGKAIAGGMPTAVYGFTAELAQRMEQLLATKPAGHSGMGTTLAANALATAALVACLQEVMTDDAYEHMLNLSATLAEGLRKRIAERALPWHVISVGARSELVFTPTPARTARESLSAASPTLERLLHLYLLNRGVLVTPFHNMMLVSPATSAAQVQSLLELLGEFLHELS